MNVLVPDKDAPPGLLGRELFATRLVEGRAEHGGRAGG
jgi:hypothetical protein